LGWFDLLKGEDSVHPTSRIPEEGENADGLNPPKHGNKKPIKHDHVGFGNIRGKLRGRARRASDQS